MSDIGSDKNMDEKCSTKFCRGKVDVVYLGKPLCQQCYERICEYEDINQCPIHNIENPDCEQCVSLGYSHNGCVRGHTLLSLRKKLEDHLTVVG